MEAKEVEEEGVSAMRSEDYLFRALVLRALLMILGFLTKTPDLKPAHLVQQLGVEAEHYTRLAEDMHAAGR